MVAPWQFDNWQWLSLTLAAPVVVWGAWPFHRAACRQMGWKGPLHRCSVYDRKDVGQKLNAMLAMGESRPWPEALAALTGQKQMDATAIRYYFAPLHYMSGEIIIDGKNISGILYLTITLK